MPSSERWILGLLLVACSTVFWFVVTDTRDNVRILNTTVHINSGRISSVEARISSIERTNSELRDDLKEHRYRTEETPNSPNRKNGPH